MKNADAAYVQLRETSSQLIQIALVDTENVLPIDDVAYINTKDIG